MEILIIVGVIAVLLMLLFFRKGSNSSENSEVSSDNTLNSTSVPFELVINSKSGKKYTGKKRANHLSGGRITDWYFYDEFGDLIDDIILITLLFDCMGDSVYYDELKL
jgi:hypothetical protein